MTTPCPTAVSEGVGVPQPRPHFHSWTRIGTRTIPGVERKLATVLFVDLVSSTDLVAGADPEVVRRRGNRFFDPVSHCGVSHGGVVEKFAGHAGISPFRIPPAPREGGPRARSPGPAVPDPGHQLRPHGP